MNRFRILTTVLSIAMVLLLTFAVYQEFGIGDGITWLKDILTLVLILFLVFLAAFGVVGLLMLFRKHRGEI